MSAELIFLLVFVILACIVFWEVHKKKLEGSSQHQPETDPFMQQVASDEAQIGEAVITAIQQHEHELEERFAGDKRQLKLKEQLSQFARMHKLDEALIELWEEIQRYPEWSSQEGFDKWNKLDFKGISGSSEKDINSVEFLHKGQRFNVKERTQSETRELNANLSFFEDGDEVFAIDCLVNSKDEGTGYICQHISAFKKRGNWPKVLLECFGRLKIEKVKSMNEIKYFRADEIKSHFEG